MISDADNRIAAMSPAERAALPDSERLKPNEAAAFAGCSAAHLAKLRVTGGGPAFIKIHAHRVLYEVGDLRAFLASRRRQSTSAQAAA
jgi:hypothetical protein